MSDDDHGVRPSEEEGGASDKPAGFPTVGIGTSAGGVHALQMFFESLPDEVDAAFVVVVHLDPSRQSELSNILAARTRMPVTQVTGLTPIEPRHVYVIPPNRQLRVTDHHLAITEFDEPRWQRAPIDLFFRSLAAEGATTSPSFFPAPVRTGRSASRRSRRPEASSWSRTRTRPNMAPCRAAPSPQALLISFCPYEKWPPGFPN
jgi:CheB methylesterase